MVVPSASCDPVVVSVYQLRMVKYALSPPTENSEPVSKIHRLRSRHTRLSMFSKFAAPPCLAR